MTHGLSDVLGICDRALWLNTAECEIGDPSDIVDGYTGVAREGRKAEQMEGTLGIGRRASCRWS